MMVFLVKSCYGSYEDYYERVEGIYSSVFTAHKVAKEISFQYDVDESKLPMTFDEFDLRYGDFEKSETDKLNTALKKYGNSIEEYNLMVEKLNVLYEHFNECIVAPHILDNPSPKFTNENFVVFNPNKDKYQIMCNSTNSKC